MNTLWIEILFWIALFIVFYTYLGYGILLYLLVKVKELFVKSPVRSLPPENELPEVTLFITAFNEEEVVDEKMENSLALDYPTDRLHIVWVTDGSNDGTNERLLTHWNGKATLLFQPERQGKTAAMNRGKLSSAVFPGAINKTPVSVPKDQLLCLPDPFTPLKGFS